MSDPCAPLVQLLQTLENQRQQLLNSLPSLTAEGLNLWPTQEQIRSLGEQIEAATVQLANCRANASHPPPAEPFVLVEQTQAIQVFQVPYYQYPLVGQIPPGNNSIPMVSAKATVLRVYVDVSSSNPKAILPSGLIGNLKIQTASATLTIFPLNEGATVAQPIDNIDRTVFDETINFLIPAQDCSGTITYTINILDADTGNSYAQTSGEITFETLPDLKFHCVIVHYVGLNGANQAVDLTPSLADVLASLETVVNVYPISGLSFDGCETLEWTQQLSKSGNWQPLLDKVSALREASGSNALYLGFVPAAADCGGICGLGNIGGGSCIFRVGGDFDPVVSIAHEMGHAIGRIHAPECLPPGQAGDTSYPQYGQFPRASIGEVGLDMRTFPFQTEDPASVRDYMSYCTLRWTSPYGYMFAYNVFKSGKFSDSANPLSATVSAEMYYVTFSWDAVHRSITVNSGLHVLRPVEDLSLMVFSAISATIVDADNVTMCRVYASSMQDSDDPGNVQQLQLVFPRMDGMHRLMMMLGNELIGEIPFSLSAPKVSISRVQINGDENHRWAKVTWKASADEGAVPALQCALRYSSDGCHWRALTTDAPKKEALIDLDLLPGGDNCRVQVLASAGLRTSVAESAPFPVKRKPRKIYLRSPEPSASYEAGDRVSCAGSAFSPDFGNADAADIIWTSLRHGFLGSGQQILTPPLSAGTHWIQIHAPDGTGNLVTQQMEIHVKPIRNVVASGTGRKQSRGANARPCGCKH